MFNSRQFQRDNGVNPEQTINQQNINQAGLRQSQAQSQGQADVGINGQFQVGGAGIATAVIDMAYLEQAANDDGPNSNAAGDGLKYKVSELFYFVTIG